MDSFVIPIFGESPPSGDPWFVRLETWTNDNVILLPGFLDRVMEVEESETISCRLSLSSPWTGSVASAEIPHLPLGAVGSLGCGPESPFAKIFPVFSLRAYLSSESSTYSSLSLDSLECSPQYHSLVESSDSWIVSASVHIKFAMDVDGELWKNVPVSVEYIEISNRPSMVLDQATWQMFSQAVLEQSGDWHTDDMGRFFTDEDENCAYLVTQKFPRISVKPKDSEMEYQIGPEEYTIVGSPSDPSSGCTLNVVEGSFISTGSPFLVNHAIEFDSMNQRVGIC